jgi:sugar lactone lactonase YvrE
MRSSNCLVFDGSRCQLGEAAFWHESRRSFVWLDILARELYEKSVSGSLNKCDLSFTATAILPAIDISSNGVRLVAGSGIYELDLESAEVVKLYTISLPESHRTNDAGLDPEGRIVFGVMELQPAGLNGWISRIEQDGTLTQLVDCVGIPNTITWSASGQNMYYADSFEQVMYVAEYSQMKISEFFSLKESLATPDGSCLLGENLYTAEWDGWRVTKRCVKTGVLQAELAMPVPRPTSCVIYDGHILITSASDGLEAYELSAAPDSGKTFIATIEDFVSIK